MLVEVSGKEPRALDLLASCLTCIYSPPIDILNPRRWHHQYDADNSF